MGEQGGDRDRRLVALQDGFEELGRGGRLQQGLRDGGGVVVDVADLDPGVVGDPAAAEHRVNFEW